MENYVLPAQEADKTCTMAVSGLRMELKKDFAWEQAQKQMAREGATPTRLGPRPLKRAFGPSF